MSEKFGKIIATLSFLVLMLSVTSEWAYFGVVGPELQGSLSVYDYLASTLSWLPTMVIIWFLMGVLQYLSNPKMVRSALELWIYNILGLTFVALAVIGFFWGGHARALTLPNLAAFLYLWSVFTGRMKSRIEHLASLPKEVVIIFFGDQRCLR